MGVYNPFGKIPNSCVLCGSNGDCDLCREYVGRMIGRHPNCPLVEIPKHGRLIDADALESVIGKHPLNWEYGQGVEDCWSDLQNAPTVIEAEE